MEHSRSLETRGRRKRKWFLASLLENGENGDMFVLKSGSQDRQKTDRQTVCERGGAYCVEN